ncbi:MAG: HD domain-containing protein [Euryarchaeota archaeon RBG_16_62_10]|nr:MAG: HD domain-containing protein [Euryarchaeota archaeon RBG_16_62_10]
MPSRDDCLRILRDHGCPQDVVSHCEAVSDLAVKIARKCRADVPLVESGSLLHDLGRCRSHKLDHAVRGAELASELKFPAAVVRIIERHIGAGITKKEAKALGLPERDYTPKTLEEKIVAHADNLISASRRTGIEEAVGHLVRKGHHEAALRVLRLHEELSAACRMNIDDIY